VQVISSYLSRFQSQRVRAELVASIGNEKNRKNVIEKTLELFDELDVDENRSCFVFYDNAFTRIGDKRYISLYLEWLANRQLASEMPFTMDMIGRWKVPEGKQEQGDRQVC